MNEFEQAEELLRQTPMPEDIREQLDALRKTVEPELLILFDNYYEAAEAGS